MSTFSDSILKLMHSDISSKNKNECLLGTYFVGALHPLIKPSEPKNVVAFDYS